MQLVSFNKLPGYLIQTVFICCSFFAFEKYTKMIYKPPSTSKGFTYPKHSMYVTKITTFKEKSLNIWFTQIPMMNYFVTLWMKEWLKNLQKVEGNKSLPCVYLVRTYLEVNPHDKAYGWADQSMKKPVLMDLILLLQQFRLGASTESVPSVNNWMICMRTELWNVEENNRR